jgi:hypothetical protein
MKAIKNPSSKPPIDDLFEGFLIQQYIIEVQPTGLYRTQGVSLILGNGLGSLSFELNH